MNILASYNWIKKYLKTDLSAEEFARRTTSAGNGVEHMHDLARAYEHMVVGLVVTVKAHPNANKLRIAEVDIGDRKVEIVCGGANLAEGQRVVAALPGSMVRWHGEGDLVEIKETELRGVASYGMICAAAEIGFEKLPQGDHDIWDISEIAKDARPGTPVAQALGLDDVIMDIEVTTNRPDAKAIVGQAREGAAATGAAFTWKSGKVPVAKGEKRPLRIHVEDTQLCTKYEAVRLEGVTVGPSPWWMQRDLLLAGMKPINNVVDATNYVLHELGQPLHAFDADTLAGAAELSVRRAHTGEKIVALDGKEYELTEKMLVIADTERPVAIAGVMGGLASGTTAQTTNVIIEAATFDPVSIRRTARALNLYSDSSQLFERGLSTEATSAALARVVELILETAGGRVASDVWTHRSAPYKPLRFPFNPAEASALIGVEIDAKKQLEMLEHLGFTPVKNGKAFEVEVPYWRDHDIEDRRDFVEEIARLFGYENVPSRLPDGELPAFAIDPVLALERRVKELMRAAGATESYAYAFVSSQQLERYELPVEAAVRLNNPLSSDQEYMRPSLVPSMLTAIEENQVSFPQDVVFEVAPVYLPSSTDIPEHRLMLTLAVYEKDGVAAFARAKGALERLMRELGVRTWMLDRAEVPPQFHAGRSARVVVDGVNMGMLGEITPEITKAFGVDVRPVILELNLEALVAHTHATKSYHPIPLFQDVKRDLALVVADRVEYGTVETLMRRASTLVASVELFDVYRGKGVEQGKKSLAMHLSFRAADKTLSAEKVDGEMKKIEEAAAKEVGAEVRA